LCSESFDGLMNWRNRSAENDLDSGEYGFIGTFTYTTVGVAGSGERIYDFGIARKLE
jgi:hypothetical protein